MHVVESLPHLRIPELNPKSLEKHPKQDLLDNNMLIPFGRQRNPFKLPKLRKVIATPVRTTEKTI